MRKKGTLYVVNKHNKKLFEPEGNLFYVGGDTRNSVQNILSTQGLPIDISGYNGLSLIPTQGISIGSTITPTLNPTLRNVEAKPLEAQNKNWFGLSKEENPFSRQNIQGGPKAMLNTGIGGAVLGALGNIGNQALYKGLSGGLSSGTGAAISNVGNVVGNALGQVPGVGKFAGPAVQLFSGAIGGGVNALVGTAVDQEKKAANNVGTAQLNNTTYTGNSTDELAAQRAAQTAVANIQDAHRSGIWNKGWSKKRNAADREARLLAEQFADRSFDNAIYNVSQDQLNDALANYSAFGGPLGLIGESNNMGAIEYGLMSDYLTGLNNRVKQKNTTTTFVGEPQSTLFSEGGGIHIKPENRGKFTKLKERTGHSATWFKEHGTPAQKKMATFALNAKHWKHAYGGLLNEPDMPLFAFGGDLQTNGADYPTGLTHISAGGLHEENPNQGVQMGVDPQGVPNLVEENEVVFDDYVYSNRISCDNVTKGKFHIGKKKDITYADLAKKLEKEISERPNDPISRAGFEAQMHDLAEEQERQKQEMEAERAKAAFEALSPEEQVAIMQQAAQEEQAAQEAQAQQAQANLGGEPQVAGSPEEAAMMEQQMMAQQAQQQMPQEMAAQAPMQQEQPMVQAYGGKINRFDEGGDLDPIAKALFKKLGFSTMSDYFKWQEENGINNDLWRNANGKGIKAWKKVFADEAFKKAVNDTALLDALEKGYDFGVYQPTNADKATIQSISKGNWKATNGKGWRGSEDLAFKQATEGLSDAEIDALTAEQLAERIRNTEAYKNTNKWLENADNALLYLNTLYNDPNTPQVAKDYAAKFIKDGKWKDGFNYDYATVFGSNGKGVRETNPGTYWHTAMEANRGRQAQNLVWDEENKTWEPIIGDVPTDWTSAGSYSWANPENDYTYNYYRRPETTTRAADEDTTDTTGTGVIATGNGEDNIEVEPVLRKEWPRYVGLLGPAVGLGLQLAGVGKPDTSGMDDALAQAARGYHLATNKYLGNYMRYKPLDTWFHQAKIDAQARATDRNILNTSGGNRGTAMAGLLANGLNSQIASGENLRQDNLYNRNDEFRTEEFNKDTDKFNAQAFNDLSRFNTSEANRTRQFNAQLNMQAARDKADLNAGWYNSLYGNIGGLFKGISDLGRENAQHNMIAEMAADGIFGPMSPITNVGRKGKYLTWKKSSNGGKINRRK